MFHLNIMISWLVCTRYKMIDSTPYEEKKKRNIGNSGDFGN